MKKTFTIAAILAIGLIKIEAYATEEDDQIRQECEMQIQSYGISDVDEYRWIPADCIDSMSSAIPVEQYESKELSADQT